MRARRFPYKPIRRPLVKMTADWLAADDGRESRKVLRAFDELEFILKGDASAAIEACKQAS